MNKKYLIIVIVLLSATVGLSAVMADEAIPATKQKTHVLQRIGVRGTPYVVGMGIAKLAPNTMKSRHMHTGPEVGYVLEGEIILMIEGQPAKTIKAGESFQTPAYAVHVTKAGPKGAKIIATWVAEQGKPISVPAQ